MLHCPAHQTVKQLTTRDTSDCCKPKAAPGFRIFALVQPALAPPQRGAKQSGGGAPRRRRERSRRGRLEGVQKVCTRSIVSSTTGLIRTGDEYLYDFKGVQSAPDSAWVGAYRKDGPELRHAFSGRTAFPGATLRQLAGRHDGRHRRRMSGSLNRLRAWRRRRAGTAARWRT